MNEDEYEVTDPGMDPSNLLLIVVGAHLRAEQADRPLAYRLRQTIHDWIEVHTDGLDETIEPLVCSDIWYLNHEVLFQRPTVSIGGPGVNALSTYFGQKLDAATVSDKQVIIQLDPEFIDLRVCIWGMDHDQTRAALLAFEERYLDQYLQAVANQVEPKVD